MKCDLSCFSNQSVQLLMRRDMSRLYLESERCVVFLAIAQSPIDEAHQFHGAAKAEALVAGTIDVLIEDVAQPLLVQS
jgi:hypothetical protein